MPGTPTYAVQVYKREDGRIVRDRRILVPSLDEAIHTAAAMIPTVPFAAALSLTSDDEGRVWTTEVVGSFGEMPDEVELSRLDEGRSGNSARAATNASASASVLKCLRWMAGVPAEAR